ncbi:putative adhesin [Streptomyces sp. NPDC057910]|uniref:putative adhesin n=1 Tax=Streptomyces sp. NPDC057910 TaxID=3346278 RepID=UPI0036E359F3
MGYVLLGHGGLHSSSTGMDIVAIPHGTTIQYYTEAGQRLLYSSRQLDRWDGQRTPWAALNSSNVTYNLTLESDEEYENELRNDPALGGHELIRPGIGDIPDPARLCEGTPATCPSDPRQVAQGWDHHCGGLLGLLRGELHWLACTPLPPTAQTGVVLAGMLPSVLLGEELDWVPPAVSAGADAAAFRVDSTPGWTPDASDLQAIAQINAVNVLSAGADVPLHYAIHGGMLLVGDREHFGHQHDPRHVAYMTDNEASGGFCMVAFNGVFHVDLDPSSPHCYLVEAAFARYSDDRVRFGWIPPF